MSRPDINLQDLANGLKQDWCTSFDVLPLGDGTWTIASPFIMPDGDGFAVVLKETAEGWLLTDAGTTAARAFADLDVGPNSEERFTQTAKNLGLSVDDWELSLALPDFPDSLDVSYFLRGTTAAYMIPELLSRDGEAREDYYIGRLREAVVERLAPGVRSDNNWYPPQDENKLYRTDLRISAPARPVLVFAVGTNERASLTALSVRKYQEWGVDGTLFAAVRPTVGGKAVARLQDTLGDEQVARIDPKERFKIIRVFQDFGVPMVAA